MLCHTTSHSGSREGRVTPLWEGGAPTCRVMPITGLAMAGCKSLGRRQNNQRVKHDYPSLFWLNFFEKEDREALGGWRESEKQRRPLRKIDSELSASSAVSLGPPQQGRLNLSSTSQHSSVSGGMEGDGVPVLLVERYPGACWELSGECAGRE